MSLLTGVAYKPLEDGMHSVRLKHIEERSLVKDNETQEYVRFEWQFSNGRVLVDNRFGAGQLSIAMSQLKQQFDPDSEIVDYAALINKAKSHDVNMWISHNAQNGKVYTNLRFTPPPVVLTPETDEEDF